MSIWTHIDYREYLKDRLGPEGTRSGHRKRLAEAVQVHTSFVSQVLSGMQNFSAEQGEAINVFLSHNELEGDYFHLLLSHARAGTSALRKRYEKKIKEMKQQHGSIKKRLESGQEISDKDREKFYSSYLYGAVHVLASIPKFQDARKMSETLKVDLRTVSEAAKFLVQIGVLSERSGRLEPGSKHIHLGHESHLIGRHHTNWRLFTAHNLNFSDGNATHYSGCMSLSESDVERIREILLKGLKDTVGVVSKSKEETAYVLNLDFFRLA